MKLNKHTFNMRNLAHSEFRTIVNNSDFTTVTKFLWYVIIFLTISLSLKTNTAIAQSLTVIFSQVHKFININALASIETK